jgi:hypothetical protein
MLRRILFILTVPAMLLAPVLFATAAQAQSPHFVGTPDLHQVGNRRPDLQRESRRAG